MKRLFTGIIVFLLFSISLQAQTTITQWTFNGTLVPSTGSGSVQTIGGITGAFVKNTGDTQSTDPAAVPPDSTYETTFYPDPTANDRTAGIQFAVSTVGFNTIKLVFDQRLSNKAANTWAVFYTADVTAGSPVWTEMSGQLLTFVPDASTTGDRWWNQRMIDFSAITAISDNPKAGFKIVAAFDPALNTTYVAARSTSTYAGGSNSGTVRFDMLTITGVPVAGNDAPTASAVSVSGVVSNGRTISGAYTYNDAEGDPEGASTYKWYRASDAAGTGAAVIGAATAQQYVLTAGDIGKFISFEVTPLAETGDSPGDAVPSDFAGPVLDLANASGIKINEVYSRGLDTNPDPDLHADWVEFYNPGNKDVTLAGLRICDSGACEDLSENAYAQLIVPAGSFLSLQEDGDHSFTFGLSSMGEYVVLKNPDNSVIDSLNFPALEDTVSYGRFPDASAVLDTLSPPTRGGSNNTAHPVHPPVEGGGEVTGLRDEALSILVYPVPSSGDILVEAPQVIHRVVLVNQLGQEVGSTLPESKTVRVSTAAVSKGFYLMKISYGSGRVEVRRVIKE